VQKNDTEDSHFVKENRFSPEKKAGSPVIFRKIGDFFVKKGSITVVPVVPASVFHEFKQMTIIIIPVVHLPESILLK
jgi:hypothetical protein